MINIQNIKTHILLALPLLFFVCSFTVFPSAHAAAPADPVKVACEKNFLKTQDKKDACTADNILLAKKTANQVCREIDMKGAEGPIAKSCTEKYAVQYVNQAYKTIKPKTPTNFTRQLGNVTQKALDEIANKKNAAAAANRKCSVDNCDIVGKYLAPTINVLASLVGVIAILSLIIGGIQYTMSGSDPQKINNAKSRISTTIIALVAFFLLYGMLQFLVPGGIFNK